jgi:hypothetical protein
VIKKDFLVMRTGLALIAATIFTVKYYYSILPAEVEMLAAGLMLVALSYALIKYLTMPKHGYTSGNIYQSKNILNVEALIVAETFSSKSSTDNNTLYGGGSGGGGGATGEY